MRPRRLIVLTMSVCGLLAGLAGAIEMLGITHTDTSLLRDDRRLRLHRGRSARPVHPVGSLLAALLFGAMRAGAGLMQIEAGIPIELVDVLQATILLFLVASPVLAACSRCGGVKPHWDRADRSPSPTAAEAVS